MNELSSNSVIILAAGRGSRLKSSIPKVFHRIGGLSLVDHVIKSAMEVKAGEIVVVLNPEYENFELRYGKYSKKALQKVPNGSGDAVKCALEILGNADKPGSYGHDGKFLYSGGWVYILYADIPLISSEILLAAAETAKKCDKTAVVVLAMDSDNHQNLGKLKPGEIDGTIRGIVEARELTENDQIIPLCNAGLLVREDVLRNLIDKIVPSSCSGEIYITEIVRLAYEAGFICRYVEGEVSELSGANTRSELARLEGYFQQKMREKHMDNGVTLLAPETVFFSHDTEIENDVTIYPNVVFLENVRVKKGSSIGPFCVLEGAKIEGASVGPFARIRPSSEIGSGARIGNFVEIKNSRISEEVKVNHLSYIGDSFLGEQTNVGAGTITCNYDGFAKHRTYIGKNVFIGSNSAMVAPIKICDNVIVGAGSVITKDVDAGDLAISRSPQRNIANWAAKFRETFGSLKRRKRNGEL